MSADAVSELVKVPFNDLAREAEALGTELAAAAARVIASGRYILGPEVEAFEREAAEYLGVRYAVGVASGTDALWLSLRAGGVGPGDRVLTTPFTFFATVSAIVQVGAEPVFADIDPDSFNIDPAAVRRALNGDIRAIVPVHLYGRLAEVEGGALVVEDAAQAFGTPGAGSRGDLACFSFFPAKNLGALGDGGLVTTNGDDLAERVRLLRAHGARPRYHHHALGGNSRLDALQAALLRVKLPHLDSWLAARRSRADAYDAGLVSLEGVRTPPQPPEGSHSFHLYTLRVFGGLRDRLREHLAARGVETAVYYPVPAHLQPALAHLGYGPGDFPESERACEEVVSLPISPWLREDEQAYVIDSVTGFFR